MEAPTSSSPPVDSQPTLTPFKFDASFKAQPSKWPPAPGTAAAAERLGKHVPSVAAAIAAAEAVEDVAKPTSRPDVGCRRRGRGIR